MSSTPGWQREPDRPERFEPALDHGIAGRQRDPEPAGTLDDRAGQDERAQVGQSIAERQIVGGLTAGAVKG